MLICEITKENINKMVIRFYTKILNDKAIGPFFVEKLGDDLNNDTWKPHISLLTNFWASIALGDQNYRGNPLAPHLEIQGLKRESFDQWLKLFFETLDSIYEPHIAEQFKQRSNDNRWKFYEKFEDSLAGLKDPQYSLFFYKWNDSITNSINTL